MKRISQTFIVRDRKYIVDTKRMLLVLFLVTASLVVQMYPGIDQNATEYGFYGIEM